MIFTILFPIIQTVFNEKLLLQYLKSHSKEGPKYSITMITSSFFLQISYIFGIPAININNKSI